MMARSAPAVNSSPVAEAAEFTAAFMDEAVAEEGISVPASAGSCGPYSGAGRAESQEQKVVCSERLVLEARGLSAAKSIE